MEIKLGPYILYKRTEYSRFRLLSARTRKDVTDDNKDILEEMVSEYEKQTENPEKYFNIDGDILKSITDFVRDEKVKYLFVPDNITTLDDSALEFGLFSYIYLPKALEKINKCAFYQCINLKDIDIPESVNYIGTLAFRQCRELESIIIPNIEEIEDSTFYYCSNLKSVTMSSTVRKIGQDVFRACKKLEYIELSKNLEKIDERAFYECCSLKEINLPDGLRQIKGRCFMGCESLKSIKIPNSLVELEYDMFINCSNLEKVEFSENICTLDGALFAGCISLHSIEIPEKLCTINGLPFLNSSVESLTFKHDLEALSIIDVYDYDLLGMSDIQKIIVDKNVRTIAPNAFSRCGRQITELEYLGTEEEFKEFFDNNSELFKHLNVEKITCEESMGENDLMKYLDR